MTEIVINSKIGATFNLIGGDTPSADEIKYNLPHGTVFLGLAPNENGTLRVSVMDTGRGIAEGMRDRVFEPFDRLGVEKSSTPGTGIGLSFSKQLIERMWGGIGFKSKVGKGTTFWIDVPFAPTDLTETVPAYISKGKTSVS